MKKFKTISEYEILTYTYNSLLDRYLKEEKHNDVISKIKSDKYKKQMDEIEERLIELENNKW